MFSFGSVFFVLSTLILSAYDAAGQRRSLKVVNDELREVQRKLIEMSDDGQPLWNAGFSDNAFTPKEDFPVGVLLEKPKKIDPAPGRIPVADSPANKRGFVMPESYSVADYYSNRCPSTKQVIFQGQCGNCWAMATISMVNDRVCMYRPYQQPQSYYSIKQLTLCAASPCKGQHIINALYYWQHFGIYTGGTGDDFQPDGCLPLPDDRSDMANMTCTNTCDDGTYLSKSPRSFGAQPYTIVSRKPEDIKREIINFGPVIASFTLYDDLYRFYRSGIYVRVSDEVIGGHAVKIFGWGVENGTEYWRVQNSWGSWWGEEGFFRVRMGTNEAGLESLVQASLPIEAYGYHNYGK